jgi:hypothetical protein
VRRKQSRSGTATLAAALDLVGVTAETPSWRDGVCIELELVNQAMMSWMFLPSTRIETSKAAERPLRFVIDA